MNYIKNLMKNILITLSILLLGIFLITLMNYFNLISGKFLSILKILIITISVFIGGFLTGKKSNSKGWLEGLKIGMILIIFLGIINLLFIKEISFKLFIYYFILLICSCLGSMIGISKKVT